MRLALILLLLATTAHTQPRVASYAKQSSGGFPLIAAGKIDTAAVRYLSRFDDVTLEAAPWAQTMSGAPRADVPLMLRQLNPRIRLWLYVLTGDFWLPPSFVPEARDHSAYRDIFDAINAGNGWLYDTTGAQWYENYRVNLGDSATTRRLGDVYVRLVRLHLFDGLFMDDAHTSIAWTSGPVRPLDVGRAGFRSLAAMDSARKANIERLVARTRSAGGCGFLVATNGTGPRPYNSNLDFKEGLGSFTSEAEATAWMASPGLHWLKAECYSPEECDAKAVALMRAANGRGIVSLGRDRAWPPALADGR